MDKHSVKKGKHDYKPGHGLKLRLKTGGFKLRFSISEEAWYDTTNQGPLGTDGSDINKLGGVSFLNPLNPFSWPKNRDAAMFGWRPALVYGMFEIFAYVNDSKGGHKDALMCIVDANVEYMAYCGRMDTNKSVVFKIEGKSIELPVRRRNLQVNVGPWFGGNRTSPTDHTISTELNLNPWD